MAKAVTSPSGGTIPIPPPGTWRAATWNLWWRFGADPDARLEGIEATLRHLDADVVCLQEVYSDRAGVDYAQQLGDPLGYHVVRTTDQPGVEQSLGNALLSK